MPTDLSPSGLRDFPDRLSPIVVKELRQGLRQNTFVLLFIFLQVIMAIVVFGSLAGAPIGTKESLEAGQTVSGFFFTLFAIAAVCIQPLRGLNALAGETKGGTMDLLLLTRLDSWRITFGKWLGLVGQTGLVLVAILPYLIMRYYLGGMQLFSELILLFSVFVLSASLTAVAVGFSSLSSVVLRVLLVPLIGFPIVGGIFGFAASSLIGGRGGSLFEIDFSRPGSLAAYLVAVAVCLFTGYYFLEMAATHIAPPSENRSTRKRLIGVAVLGGVAGFFHDQPEAAYGICLGLSCLLAIDALTENPVFTASVTRPFVRFGPAGRLFGRVFYPGWASGLLYLALLAAGCALLALRIPDAADKRFIAFGLTCNIFSSLLFPAVLIAAFRPRETHTFGLYLVVSMGVTIVTGILTILANALNAEEMLAWLFFVAPPLGLMGIDELDNAKEFYTILSGCVFTAYCALLFVFSLKHWKRIGEIERPAPAPAQATAHEPA